MATKSHEQMAAVAAALAEAGYVVDGETRRETVRIPTVRSPVFGGIGGELATFGGRTRFSRPGTTAKATVGPRTTALYDVIDHKAANMRSFATRDIAAIRAALDTTEPSPSP